MLHADQDGEKVQALLRLLTELMERVRVVDALSNVPQMYCLAVVEVVRRKMFMRHYREVRAIPDVPVLSRRQLLSRPTPANWLMLRVCHVLSISVGILAGEGRENAVRCREAEEGIIWETFP